MSIKLRYDPGVKGINLFGNELKLSQFADDTNLFLCRFNFSEKSFKYSPRLR